MQKKYGFSEVPVAHCNCVDLCYTYSLSFYIFETKLNQVPVAIAMKDGYKCMLDIQLTTPH